MRKKDRIISLIKSLSQGEKKYFVQRSKSTNKDKSYFKLYELLLAKESYNSAALCRQLKKDTARLANEKKYLEKQLLSALREYHEAHPHVAALNRLAEGVLLMERNLDDLAESSLANSIKLSSTSGLLPLQWHANGLMLTLCGHPFASSQHTKSIAEYHLTQMELLARQITLSTDFERLNNEVFEAYEKRKADITDKHKTETRNLLNNRLLKTDYHNFLFASYRYSLQSLLYMRCGNIAASIEVNRNLVSLLERQPKIDALAYWTAIANLTQSIIAGGNKQEYDMWMEKLQSRHYKKLPVDPEYIDQLLQKHKNIFRSGVLFYQLFKKEIPVEEIREFVKKFLRSLRREKQNTPVFHYTSTLYKTAACALVTDEVDDSVDLLNVLLNDSDTTINSTANKNARLLFIMAHIQKKNYQLVPSLTKSVLHYLKKSVQDYKAEAFLLKQFEDIAMVHNHKDYRKWLLNMKRVVKEIEQHAENRKMLDMIPIRTWINNLEEIDSATVTYTR